MILLKEWIVEASVSLRLFGAHKKAEPVCKLQTYKSKNWVFISTEKKDTYVSAENH